MSWVANPAFVALIVAMPSALIGYLGYKRSQKVDAIAEQAGIATVASGTISQVIEGLNNLVDNLQADNKVLRDNIHALDDKLARVIAHCEDLKRQLADLSKRVPNGQ